MYIKVHGKDGAAPHTKRTPSKQRSAFNKRGNKVSDTRISICILCRRGIFPQHEYKWTADGLVHNACDDKRHDEAEDAPAALSE